MTTRETILRAWWAAKRQSVRTGVVSLDATAFAGYALERADGNPSDAHGQRETRASTGSVGGRSPARRRAALLAGPFIGKLLAVVAERALWAASPASKPLDRPPLLRAVGHAAFL